MYQIFLSSHFYSNAVNEVIVCKHITLIEVEEILGVNMPTLGIDKATSNRPVSQYEHPRSVALASSACVVKTTKIITEFTAKILFYI